jgi:hypothetical protein
LGDRRNLVHNASFELAEQVERDPWAWLPPIEDQWVSWVGNQFRPPRIDQHNAVNGSRSLRASVTYADISGVSQIIHLNQDRPRAVLIGVWSKLDNSIGNRPPGYHGPDNLPNLTVFVYHQDGTMQEVSPTLCLGESDHDWDYRRGGFLPEKPVDKIRVQVTLVGTEPTTSLWIDDVTVFELSEHENQELPSERFAPNRVLVSTRGMLDSRPTDRVTAANDTESLYLSIPRPKKCFETLVFLNPDSEAEFVNHYRYLYDVLRIADDGRIEKGVVAEKQGYVATGQYVDGEGVGVTSQTTEDAYTIHVPFSALRLDGPPDHPIGFNVQWKLPNGGDLWSGKAINTAQLGRLIPASPPGVTIRSVRFGGRYEHESEQSQDFVSHPPMYAGMNDAEVCLANLGPATEFELVAGVRGRPPFKGVFQIASNEDKAISFQYDAGIGHLGVFDVVLWAGDQEILRADFPLEVPSAIEVVLDQEFYFPEEEQATVEIHSRIRPIPEHGRVNLEMVDVTTGNVVFELAQELSTRVSSMSFPLGELRINPLPVQDYEARISYVDSANMLLGTRSARLGRIRHTERRPLPPIDTVRVDDSGRLIINDDFRFFPIVASLARAEWDEAIQLGANILRPYHRPADPIDENTTGLLEEIERAWSVGAYTFPVGIAPHQVDTFEIDAPRLLAHPGFLGCYPMQFYYWKLSDELLAYRERVEQIFAAQPSPRLLVWGHHDSSFLYDRNRSGSLRADVPVGYCYTKIMGRPGSAWRNAPFLTQTEQVLDPHRFKLGEVNYYAAWHDDEIVPEHFTTYYSIRGDDWRGVRKESYLAVIHGANGLYHYLCTQQGGVQRLRGWFQELNHMWPVFVADDAEHRISVEPADSSIDARVKQWNGKLYLLTANAGGAACDAVIRLDGVSRMHVRKLFDVPGDMAVNGHAVADAWEESDAFVYELQIPPPGR